MVRLREATAPYPKAALFELAAEGHDSVFEILIACLISIRTRDETTLPVARQLFARARTAAEMVRLGVEEIDQLIRLSTHHEMKAPRIHAIARKTVDDYGGELPCDAAALLG
jgi:endonuclease-3